MFLPRTRVSIRPTSVALFTCVILTGCASDKNKDKNTTPEIQTSTLAQAGSGGITPEAGGGGLKVPCSTCRVLLGAENSSVEVKITSDQGNLKNLQVRIDKKNGKMLCETIESVFRVEEDSRHPLKITVSDPNEVEAAYFFWEYSNCDEQGTNCTGTCAPGVDLGPSGAHVCDESGENCQTTPGQNLPSLDTYYTVTSTGGCKTKLECPTD